MKYSTFVRDRGNMRRSINTAASFADAYSSISSDRLDSFDIVLNKAEELVKTEYSPTTAAIGNSRGRWYEWLIALGGIQYALSRDTANILVKLPNIISLDCSRLYVPNIFELISDLREKLHTTTNVSLITSNPDFVIIKRSDNNIPSIPENLSVEFLEEIDAFYETFIGKCEFGDIIGFIGVKMSLRPDRRLQLSHEGSLMKALYKHIQTRTWNLSAPGLRYYSIAGHVGSADLQALQTVATHSIVSVNANPEAAVDNLFEVNTKSQLNTALSKIML